MLNYIRKFFEYKTKSLDEFVEVIKKEGCKSITITPELGENNATLTASVGTIADWEYNLVFTSKTPQGRNVIYRQKEFERFGSDFGIPDQESRRDSVITLFLLAEEKMHALRYQYSDMSVHIIGPKGQMDDETLDRLHQDADRLGISI